MLTALVILVTYILLALPAAIIGLPWVLLRGRIGLLYRWTMWILRAGIKMGGIRVEVSGSEQVPRGRPCIFMSNHVSNLDPPILLPLLPFRAAFFLKRSLLKIPILGTAIRLADFVPVVRDGNQENARKSVEIARGVLSSGVHICTFPEGTRSSTGKLLPFKKGPFYLAMESGALVVPVSIWGTEGMMPKGTLRIRRGTAHVLFHFPIDPAGFSTREDLMTAVRSAIAAGLPSWMTGEAQKTTA